MSRKFWDICNKRRRVVVVIPDHEHDIQQRELELAVLSVLSTLPLYEQDVLARVVLSEHGFDDLPRSAEDIHRDLPFIPASFIQKIAERALAKLRQPERASLLAPYVPFVGNRSPYVIM